MGEQIKDYKAKITDKQKILDRFNSGSDVDEIMSCRKWVNLASRGRWSHKELFENLLKTTSTQPEPIRILDFDRIWEDAKGDVWYTDKRKTMNEASDLQKQSNEREYYLALVKKMQDLMNEKITSPENLFQEICRKDYDLLPYFDQIWNVITRGGNREYICIKKEGETLADAQVQEEANKWGKISKEVCEWAKKSSSQKIARDRKRAKEKQRAIKEQSGKDAATPEWTMDMLLGEINHAGTKKSTLLDFRCKNRIEKGKSCKKTKNILHVPCRDAKHMVPLATTIWKAMKKRQQTNALLDGRR